MIKHQLADIFMDEYGHIRFYFKQKAKVELAQAMEFIDIIDQLAEGQKRCVILNTAGTFATATKEARVYVGQDPDALKMRKADALIVDNLPVRLVGNFYMKLESPQHPVKLFKSENEAIKWFDKL